MRLLGDLFGVFVAHLIGQTLAVYSVSALGRVFSTLPSIIFAGAFCIQWYFKDIVYSGDWKIYCIYR